MDTSTAISVSAEAEAQGKALLLFQIGPVQEFISQARSTRDLWSGSYLLSYMAAQTAARIATATGDADNVIFPRLAGQPLYEKLQGGNPPPDKLAIPNFPNRLLAVVPEDFDPQATLVEPIFGSVANSVWSQIVTACRNEIESVQPFSKNQGRLWECQVSHFWQTSWQMWPLSATTEDALEMIALPEGRTAEDLAGKWLGHYLCAAHRLDARRRTRAFTAAPLLPSSSSYHHHKDGLSGREEAILVDTDLANIRKKTSPLRFEFRKNDALAAPNIVKRLWPRIFLSQAGIPQRVRTFDSVPAIAAAPWLAKVKGQLESSDQVRHQLRSFASACSGLESLGDTKLARWDGEEIEAWIDATDASVFHLSEWDAAISAEEKRERSERLNAGRAALRELCHLEEVGGPPSKYFAVLAMDGDEMGKWISGEKAGRENVDEQYHKEFSARLSNFALHAVLPIVNAHHGRLIYAGGDDVLAMLPATEAVACANALRMAFCGESGLDQLSGVFDACEEGYIRPSGATRSYPVPGGTATMSGGIVMGHIKAPLQDMVRMAHSLEKKAKRDAADGGYGRSALAVAAYKRSGSTIECGMRFGSRAQEMLEFLAEPGIYRPGSGNGTAPMAISGRLPYAVAAALQRYQTYSDAACEHPNPMTAELKPVALAEIRHLAGRMIDAHNPPGHPNRGRFLKISEHLLDEIEESRLPVVEFSKLLALEAFIARND